MNGNENKNDTVVLLHLETIYRTAERAYEAQKAAGFETPKAQEAFEAFKKAESAYHARRDPFETTTAAKLAALFERTPHHQCPKRSHSRELAELAERFWREYDAVPVIEHMSCLTLAAYNFVIRLTAAELVALRRLVEEGGEKEFEVVV